MVPKSNNRRSSFGRIPKLSIIIPANNEEFHIGQCLKSLLAQEGTKEDDVEVIVVSNNCSDGTFQQALALSENFAEAGWLYQVIDIPEGGKANALNQGESAALAEWRGFLDADIVLDPQVLTETLAELSRPDPAYITAAIRIAKSKNWISRQYGRIFARLPFLARGSAPGAGWFAVNGPGRARWKEFPRIISDDTFVRWHFGAHERHEIEAGYTWPLVEGFRALVRVRRRQDSGVRQLRTLRPDLSLNEQKATVGIFGHLELILSDPIGYLIYASVQLAVRFGNRDAAEWTRGGR